MDWSTSSNDSGHIHASVHNPRILASISGNIQSFASESKHHINFDKAYLHTARAASEPQYLAPCVTLGSNDQQTSNDRFATRKARWCSQPHNKVLRDRPYLQNEKYIEYRRRKRQDLGKDGKPIWPDHIEAAFQNALVHIPPLGRKKRTQRGKLLGRNELIKEWILQETGEERDRKQISSHIQVLGNVFKGVPEWTLVTKAHRDDEDEEPANCGSDYYFESIADKVRLQKELSMSVTFGDDDHSGDMTSSSSTKFTVRRLTFEMWVGMPDKVLKSLHNYTRISDRNRPSPTIELERYENWESLFPDLTGVLKGEQLDIVLLKSRFNLMTDYPPATSKLVLDLDLDFRHSASEGSPSSWMRYFTSVNHLYHNGKRLRKSEHKDCPAIEPGVVKPFFEAEWWATQFTEVTRKMKEAEEANDLTLTSTADDYSRGLFRGLTIMQEIFVSPQHSECLTSKSTRRRVAVLLWVFAQTSKSSPGVTTWQHVTVQPDWMPEGQLSSGGDACLPSLAMDSAVDDPFDIDMADNGFDLEPNVPISPMPYDSGTYYSGFTPYHMNQDSQSTFDFSGVTGFTPRASSFAAIKPDPMNHIIPINHVPPFLSSQNIQDDKATLFAGPTQPLYEAISGPEPATYDMSASLSREQSLYRNSLARFDMSTHDMLQAQLGNFDELQPNDSAQLLHDIDIAVHRDIQDADLDSQQSMTGHMNDMELDEEVLSQAMLTDDCPTTPILENQKLMLAHPTIFESPRVTRPPLLSHNSFAGVLHTAEVEDEPLHFDTPTRDEFARVISGHLDAHEEDKFGTEMVMDGFVMVGEFEPPRPRSQPMLPSNGHGYMRSDLVCFGTPI